MTTTGAMTWAGCHHLMPTSAAWQVTACTSRNQSFIKAHDCSGLCDGIGLWVLAMQAPTGHDGMCARQHIRKGGNVQVGRGIGCHCIGLGANSRRLLIRD